MDMPRRKRCAVCCRGVRPSASAGLPWASQAREHSALAASSRPTKWESRSVNDSARTCTTTRNSRAESPAVDLTSLCSRTMAATGDAESIGPAHRGAGRRLRLAQLAPGLGRGLLVRVLVLPRAQGAEELLRQCELHWRYRGWRRHRRRRAHSRGGVEHDLPRGVLVVTGRTVTQVDDQLRHPSHLLLGVDAGSRRITDDPGRGSHVS